MGIEFELKYRATPQILQQLRQQTPGAARQIEMQTTYYDTPSGQFSARRWTLRRRLENGKSVCTLKMPTDGLGRREWEISCERIEDALLELCKLAESSELSLLAAEGLISICGARFTRIAKTVQTPDCTLELALDQGILTGGDASCPLCEVEVELKDGSQEACLAYAEALARQYGLTPEPVSKFRRALDLRKEE